MCGVTGCFVGSDTTNKEVIFSWVKQAAEALEHRGPDDSGVWTDHRLGLGLGHRRLSIIDISPRGHQPMISKDERFVITYNGEVYNFPEMRKDLLANSVSFTGGSDTEVVLEGIVKWGLLATLQRADGMFALALWDRKQNHLYLARDRFGQKPLYYGWANNTFIFGSTLNALRQFPDFSADIDQNSLSLLLRHSNIPAPYTIYQNCWKLLPGTILTVTPESVRQHNIPPPKEYWSIEKSAASVNRRSSKLCKEEALENLKDTLQHSIKNCMLSDVPLGAFLSGGIDSSIVAAIMQEQSNHQVQTFSIGFSESAYDEAHYAKRVAEHLGTDHTELYITAREAQEVIPDLPIIYDEPFADSSQIPTYLVSKLAREQVTVCLSGDGGDELFGGYNRYTWSRNLQLIINTVPFPIRSVIARFFRAVPPQYWDILFANIAKLSLSKGHITLAGDKLHKLSEIIEAPNKQEMYLRLISQWKNPGAVLRGTHEYQTRVSDWNNWPAMEQFTDQIMLLDTLFYLPNDILVKLDRASMSVGLEARVPLLSHTVFEFAWSLPKRLKINDNVGKWILRELLKHYVPQALVERPKMGFGAPIGNWLRGNLRNWAEDLFNLDSPIHDLYFKPEIVQHVWKDHLSGHRNHQHILWPLLMFQAWHSQYH